ncbi:MAG: GntR family transcriptional regulator [Rhodospirillales bacterium]|nr:GntR family transcriptional regulator [Rhodospirillales bacterium]
MIAKGKRLADRVRLRLEQQIVTGELMPGTKIDEQQLADEFQISRTPVREALNQLASIGLLETKPRQGATVAILSLRDLVDMFDVMAELEGMCARLAARRLSRAERNEILAAHSKAAALVEIGDADAYYIANARLHERIYAASHNAFLENMVQGIRNRCAPYRRLQLYQGGRLSRSSAEHDAIVNAILSGDEERADQLARAHILVQGDVFNDFVAALPAALLGESSA